MEPLQLRWLVALAALHAVPLLRLLRPLWWAAGLAGAGLNRWAGFYERLLWGARMVLVVLALAIAAPLGLLPADPRPLLGGGLLLSALVFLQRRIDRAAYLKSAAEHSRLEEATFLSELDRQHGPAGRTGDLTTSEPSPVIDLTGGLDPALARPGRWALLRAFVLSLTMARIVLRAASSPYSPRLVFDNLARIWGIGVLRVARGRITTEGLHKLAGLPGRRIMMFNHVSQTDFALAYAAFDALQGGPDQMRLRFILAKDWFVDNWLIHSALGVGRCAISVGMVPIDRSNHRKALSAMSEAAEHVAAGASDIAIYPQGTRSRMLLADDGSRLDSGFYTSAEREQANKPEAHCKRGGAFLAIDTALLLQQQPEPLPVHVVLVGIEGAGRILPKKGSRILPGQDVIYRVHEVITIGADDVAELREQREPRAADKVKKRLAEALAGRIERGLAAACRIDERLADDWRRRYGRDMPPVPRLRRLYEHALSLKPEQRGALLSAIGELSLTADDPDADWRQATSPLFEQIAAA